MKPACVFCGKEPQNKNKEHIFPQWLLKLTGADQRKTSVGTNWKTGQELIFNTSSYTFPSCKLCNDRFSDIEAKAKNVVENLSGDQDVTAADLELLLDWFDKIRVGAYLGVKYFNKDVFNMDPKYYINSRLGIKDRFLSITNTYKPEKILNWSGVNSIAFMVSPTAFSLRINNLVFVNCSSDFVVSRQLGFPFVLSEIPIPGSPKTDALFSMPLKKVSSKIFNTHLYSPSITIAQPIFGNSKQDLKEYYQHEYVKNNSYDYENGIGKIFLGKNGETFTIERSDVVNFSMPHAKEVFGHVEVVRPILELQSELILSRNRDLRNLTSEQKQQDTIVKKFILDALREQIKKFRY